ncbi:MAG TPA: PIG-L family deacetylase [Thermoanaerobaculia bacterium]|nr:PIG-L family deacetylase [Thermoanaerobaculia bacterium]
MWSLLAATILAIGAHAGDAELTSGPLLVHQHLRGDRVVILHLTLGEGGNPKMAPADYAAQKKKEALAAAQAIGAEVIFAPYQDGELPDDDQSRRYGADVIRQVQPSVVITHWREGMHKDHIAANRIVRDAVLLASLEGVKTAHPAWRGVRSLWYAENWEDAPGFSPYVFVDVSDAMEKWREAVTQYEFVRGGTSSFRYLDYYTALATMRGALAGKRQAIAFDVDPEGKRRVLDAVP